MDERDVVIVGAGGHAVSVAEAAFSVGLRILAFVSPDGRQQTLMSVPVRVDFPEGFLESTGRIVVAVGDNSRREYEWKRLARNFSIGRFPPLVHASANVAESAQVSPGSVVLQGAIVGAGSKIGVGAVLNSGSIVDHETELGDFASIAPGAVTGGRVRIGERTAICIGASIKHGVVVGADTVVGAGSYVHRNVGDQAVVYGNPARFIRTRSPGDDYLGTVS